MLGGKQLIFPVRFFDCLWWLLGRAEQHGCGGRRIAKATFSSPCRYPIKPIWEHLMGLMDVLQGMSNGPRGAPAQRAGSHGVSPVALGLLALLAYKSAKGGGLFGHAGSASAPPANPPGPGAQSGGGGLLGWLGGMTGGSSGGTGANVVAGGLSELLKRFEQNGLGDAGRSWIGSGANQSVAPADVERAVGTDTLDALARELNMSTDQLRQRLSSELPQAVDKLTPEGHLPLQQDASRPIWTRIAQVTRVWPIWSATDASGEREQKRRRALARPLVSLMPSG
jgi:uncharacterized protein YidB (DUF937 family)